MEMYIQDVEGWAQGNDFFSKFGLSINKQTNVVIGRKTFRKYVPHDIISRPQEGDLVWIPIMQKLFEIKFVEKESNFYTHGKTQPYYYELQLEMFRYAQENIDTGIPEIDDIERLHSYVIELPLSGGSGDYYVNEGVTQGTITANVHSWDIANTTLSVYNINGEFTENVAVVGVESGTSWNVGVYEDLADNEDSRDYQNLEIEIDANSTFVTTEVGPFGVPWKV